MASADTGKTSGEKAMRGLAGGLGMAALVPRWEQGGEELWLLELASSGGELCGTVGIAPLSG